MKIEDMRIGHGVVVEAVGVVTKIERTEMTDSKFYETITLETKAGQILVKPEHLTILKEN